MSSVFAFNVETYLDSVWVEFAMSAGHGPKSNGDLTLSHASYQGKTGGGLHASFSLTGA